MPHSLTSMAAPSPRPSLHRFQGPLISHGSCLWLVLGVPGRQPLLQVCPHPALPQPRGCGPAPSSPRPSPAHRWSRTRCAVVCAQALSSRCPASRHLGGWRSHPRSSARTWRHLAKGGGVRAQVHTSLISHPGSSSIPPGTPKSWAQVKQGPSRLTAMGRDKGPPALYLFCFPTPYLS